MDHGVGFPVFGTDNKLITARAEISFSPIQLRDLILESLLAAHESMHESCRSHVTSGHPLDVDQGLDQTGRPTPLARALAH